MEARATSAAWATLLRSTASNSKANSTALAIQNRTWGNDLWEAGGYLAAVMVNAADSASWLAAMDQWNKTNKVKNPGMVRIVKLRGGPSNHAVLIAALLRVDIAPHTPYGLGPPTTFPVGVPPVPVMALTVSLMKWALPSTITTKTPPSW